MGPKPEAWLKVTQSVQCLLPGKRGGEAHLQGRLGDSAVEASEGLGHYWALAWDLPRGRRSFQGLHQSSLPAVSIRAEVS